MLEARVFTGYSVARIPHETVELGSIVCIRRHTEGKEGSRMKAMSMKLGVVALALVGLIGCAGGGGMSDEEAIKALVDQAMAALKAQDIDAMTAFYAEDFTSDQGGGKAEMKEFLNGAKEQGFLDGIQVDTTNTVITVDGEKATAKPIDLEGAFGALTVEFELAKRAGQWLVTYQSQY